MKKGRYGLTDNSDIASLERENSKSIGHNSKTKAVCDTKVEIKWGRGPQANQMNSAGLKPIPQISLGQAQRPIKKLRRNQSN